MPSFKYDVMGSDMEAFFDFEYVSSLRRKLRIAGLWSAIGIGLLLFWLLNLQFHSRVAAGVVAGLVALLMFYAYPGMMRDQNLKAIRRMYRDTSDAALGPKTLSVLAEHLECEGEGSSSRISWNAIQSLGFTASHAFVYLGPHKALVVPLQQLEPSSRSELVGLLRAKAPAGVAVA